MTASRSIAHSLIALTWQSAAYSIGILGRQVAIYIAIPLFTYHMSQEEFGVVSVSTALLAFILILVNAGLTPALFRLYNEAHDERGQQLTLGAAQVLVLLYAAVTMVILLAIAAPLARIVLDNAAYSYVIRIVAVLSFTETIVNYGDNLLRIQVRPLTSSVRNILQVILQLGLAFLLVRNRALGARGYWLGHLVGAALGLVFMLWLVRRSLVWLVAWQRLQELVVYALPLVPSLLALWALRMVDRLFLASMVGLEEAAVYDVGYKVGMLAGLVIPPFVAAWPQFAFSSMRNWEAPKIYSNVLTVVATGTMFSALGVVTFTSELVQALAPAAYFRATRVVPWVAFAQVGWGIYPVAVIGLHLTKRTLMISGVTILATVANVLLIIILVPAMRIEGAAIATFIAFVLLAAIGYVVAQRYYHFSLDWKRLGKLALASSLTVVLISQIDQIGLPVWTGRILRGFGLLLFPAVLLALGFLTHSQRQTLWRTGTGLLRERLGKVEQTQ